MKRKLPTILILLVMVLIGAMNWVDISYYTNPTTGFVEKGAVWMRYLVLILPLVMALLGLRTVGPHGIAVLRVKNRVLGALFLVATVTGGLYGAVSVVGALSPFSAYKLVLGILFIVYAVWMALCAAHMFTQSGPAPTQSAALGIFAALPFCVLAVYRVMVNPTSLYRVAPLVLALAAILAMLWMGMLLRSLYIALNQKRVRLAYFLGVFTFLFTTCLELPQAIHTAAFRGFDLGALLESVAMAALGLVAGAISVSIAGQAGQTSPGEDAPAEDAA